MDNDTRLKEYLIEKSKNGYAIISFCDEQNGEQLPNNRKKNMAFKKLIIEYEFEFKEIDEQTKKNEVYYNFIVFDKFDDGFNDPGVRLSEFIEICKNHSWFHNILIAHNIEEFLKDKKFYHPLLKSEKEEYLKRKEYILTDLFEPPECINGWYVRSVISETCVVYHKGDILCGISLKPDGRWLRHYGTIKPVGASLKKEYANTREEAFSNLKHPFHK